MGDAVPLDRLTVKLNYEHLDFVDPICGVGQHLGFRALNVHFQKINVLDLLTRENGINGRHFDARFQAVSR